jgi:hypothetical protein
MHRWWFDSGVVNGWWIQLRELISAFFFLSHRGLLSQSFTQEYRQLSTELTSNINKQKRFWEPRKTWTSERQIVSIISIATWRACTSRSTTRGEKAASQWWFNCICALSAARKTWSVSKVQIYEPFFDLNNLRSSDRQSEVFRGDSKNISILFGGGGGVGYMQG